MKTKKVTEMTTAELEEMTKEFDREFVADTFRPLSPAARAKWERMKRKPGRPLKGRGVKVISVSVEKELLRRSDATAKQLGITRAELVDRGLHAVLAAMGER